MRYYCEEKESVLNELHSSESGLSQQEAAKRLERDGKNALEAAKGKSLIRRFFEQMTDPMIIILIVAAIVSGVLAVVEHDSFADVIIIIAVVIVNAVLGVYQENKAEKAIEALQEMSAATSKVLRDGKIQTIHSEDLVVGDIIILEAGDAVPADARILESASLKVEESALTGESAPVTKFIDLIQLKEDEKDVPLGDRKNMLYMGGTMVYGRGTAVVTAAGMDTEMGKIAGALAQAEDDLTPLQIKLNQLSKVLTWLVLGICVVVFAIQLIKAGSLSFNLVLNSFMIAVSLAVAAIPEGLAAVVTVVLSIGVTNMSKRNAIIRRLTAVETLGCAQVICSDKTGTLTQNKMTVVDSFGADKRCLAAGMSLCSDAEIDEDGALSGEPTETALVAWANQLGLAKPDLKEESVRCGEAPFDSNRKMMSTVHTVRSQVVQYTKGAPDVVLERCTHYLKDGQTVPMTEQDRETILAANKSMADRALRVLASYFIGHFMESGVWAITDSATCAWMSKPVMASTWNVVLIYEVGAAFGQEALTDGQSGWYAPGMNIHCSPFAGRNPGYFSEDPLLTGKLAAAMISGAGDQGLYCFAKHFAVNDQETRRSKDARNHPEKYKQKASGK